MPEQSNRYYSRVPSHQYLTRARLVPRCFNFPEQNVQTIYTNSKLE